MKPLIATLLTLTLPIIGLAAEPDVRIEIRTLHLRPAADIQMIYNLLCGQHRFSLVASMSPKDRRPTAIVAQIEDGADLHKVDITSTELGQLMTDRTGFGELGFGCGVGLYVRYLGATQASDTAPPVMQSALFRISPDGAVTRQKEPGVFVTPLP